MLRFKGLLFALLICFVCVASAELDPSPLVSMAKQTVPGAHVGFMVQDMESGQWLYRWNSADSFVPASNHKLFVTSAALIGLGNEWRYVTDAVMPKGKLNKGMLQGDLVFRFVGDPSLSDADLQAMVKEIHERGIRQVQRVLLDTRRFSGVKYAPGWTHDSLAWGYSAPITAAMIDQNKMPVTLIPSSTLNKRVAVQMNGYQKGYLASSNIHTVSASDAEKRCSLNVGMSHKNQLTIMGCWPIDQPKQTLQVAIQYPERYLMDRMQHWFAYYKINVSHGFAVGHLDGKYKVVAKHQSKKLSSLLRPVLRDSNNVYAESILKTLGWKYRHTGSFQEGVNVVKDLLFKHYDIDFSSSDIFDGSGSSRYDEITPELLSRLLYVIYHDKDLYDYFYKALPSAGQNGSLQYRMGSFDLKGNVRAKTGSVKHVSTLSGYMTTRSRRHLGFVIFVNGVLGPPKRARDLQDRICQFLYHI